MAVWKRFVRRTVYGAVTDTAFTLFEEGEHDASCVVQKMASQKI